MKRPMRKSDPRYAIREFVGAEVSFAVAQDALFSATKTFLRARGWKETCFTPGARWLWEKEIDGKVRLVGERDAVDYEKASPDFMEYLRHLEGEDDDT